MLTVIVTLTLITIFVGGFTKNLLAAPLSFIFFSDSIFVKNYNFYFSFYEIFLDSYVEVHDYAINYLKFLLLLIPLVGILFSKVIFWDFDLWKTYDTLYDKSPQMVGPIARNDFSKYIWGGEFLLEKLLQRFFETKSSADQIYNLFFVKPILDFSYRVSYKELD